MYGKLPKFNKPTEYINGDLKILMRSTWEFKFIIGWIKIKKSGNMKNTHLNYQVDIPIHLIFYVKVFFMKLKVIYKKSKEKIEMFKKEYSDKKIIIVDREYFKKNGIKL